MRTFVPREKKLMTARRIFVTGLLSILWFVPAPVRADGEKANPSPAPATAPRAPTLDIYFVDVEGGAATLIITPAGESILIDSGNPGSRDPERIAATAARVGLTAIDRLITTHWHIDHYGGVERLARLLPVRHFYDHGIPDTLSEDPQGFALLIAAYKTASRGKSITVRPGDEIPLRQLAGSPPLTLRCVCGGGDVVADRPGSPPNPAAGKHVPQPADTSDNARSLGFVLGFGEFRFLDLGDLTWNVEYKLVAPTDKLGPVDVYQVTHHGLEVSSNPVLLNTVRPRVAVFNNGARKGCHPSVTAALRRIPDVQAIYQLHRNVLVPAQENTDPAMIANPDEACRGENIRLTVAADARRYAVTVGATGKPRQFETRSGK